jgi:hypothetical protein
MSADLAEAGEEATRRLRRWRREVVPFNATEPLSIVPALQGRWRLRQHTLPHVQFELRCCARRRKIAVGG